MGKFTWNMGLNGRGIYGGFGRVQNPLFSSGAKIPSMPKSWTKLPRQKHHTDGTDEETEPNTLDGENESQNLKDCETEDSENRTEDWEEEQDVSEDSEEEAAKPEREDSPMNLQKAIVWAEILGEPVSRKRRKKRMGQLYGNQSYAGRR